MKNNLQVVSSLLNLQAMRLAEGKVKEDSCAASGGRQHGAGAP